MAVTHEEPNINLGSMKTARANLQISVLVNTAFGSLIFRANEEMIITFSSKVINATVVHL